MLIFGEINSVDRQQRLLERETIRFVRLEVLARL